MLLAADVNSKDLCKTKLKEAELQKLQDAIEDLYYFEFVIGRAFVCLQRV